MNLHIYFFSFLFAFSLASSETIVIHTPSGDLRGLVEEDYQVFKGIRYAKPPIGELRWTNPVPISTWTGIYDATGNSLKNLHLTNSKRIWGRLSTELCSPTLQLPQRDERGLFVSKRLCTIGI